jgi:hypothetical protein
MATVKTPKPKAKPKLDLTKVLNAVDSRNYGFYDSLTDEEVKGFSPYVLMRYTSSVSSSDQGVHEWFIERTNERVNLHHWDLSKNHKALLWKLFAGVGIGNHIRHQYLKLNSKEKANKIEKLLCEIYPAMKLDDIKLMARMMTKEDKQELFDKMGFDKKQRKDYE